MKFCRQNKVFYFVELVLCGFAAYFLTLVINEITLSTVLQRVCIYSYFFIMLFGISGLLRVKILSFLKTYRKIAGTMFFLMCLWCIMTSVKYLPKYYGDNVITISINDKSNVQSQGKEVWLNEIRLDGEKVPLEITKYYDAGWTLGGEAIHGEYETAKKLEFVLPKARKVELIFGKHAWSGVVEVNCNNEVKQYDLYSEIGDEVRVSLLGNCAEYSGIVQMIARLGYFSVIVTFGTWGMVFIMHKNRLIPGKVLKNR